MINHKSADCDGENHGGDDDDGDDGVPPLVVKMVAIS